MKDLSKMGQGPAKYVLTVWTPEPFFWNLSETIIWWRPHQDPPVTRRSLDVKHLDGTWEAFHFGEDTNFSVRELNP